MKTLRIVCKNFGNGGCDFYEIHTRSWYWPFWMLDSWSIDLDRVQRRFEKLITRPQPKFDVIREYPET